MFWGHVLRLARRLFFRSGQQKEEQVLQEEEGYENPYLGQLRRIIEQILEQDSVRAVCAGVFRRSRFAVCAVGGGPFGQGFEPADDIDGASCIF